MHFVSKKGVGHVNSIDFIGMMLAKSSSTDYSGDSNKWVGSKGGDMF